MLKFIKILKHLLFQTERVVDEHLMRLHVDQKSQKSIFIRFISFDIDFNSQSSEVRFSFFIEPYIAKRDRIHWIGGQVSRSFCDARLSTGRLRGAQRGPRDVPTASTPSILSILTQPANASSASG